MSERVSDVTGFESLIRKFEGRKVLLIGDLVADHYIKGKTSRISREAPVLILKFLGEHVVAGQVGNTAANIAALGGQACLVGCVGSDHRGDALLAALAEAGVNTEHVIRIEGASTLTKTRILAGGHHTARQQVIRIDDDERMRLDDKHCDLVLDALNAAAEKAEVIIVSDYGYGLVNERTWKRALEIGAEKNIPVVLDSRYDLCKWQGASLITPNEEEALAVAGVSPDCGYDIRSVGRKVRELTGCKDLIITRGNEGMMLFSKDGDPVPVPIFGSDECTDVTGAGDTVVATASLALAGGASAVEAMTLSNLSGALVVMKMGTATVNRAELISSLHLIPNR